MSNWLKNRLSPVKSDTASWQELAEAIEQLWEEEFDDFLDQLQRAVSVYSADPEDLEQRISELGDFFQAIPFEEDPAIGFAWRRLELLSKSTDFIVTSMIARKFLGMHSHWIPLFAPKAGPYGSEFVREDMIPEGDEDDYFLTSRGKLRAYLAEMHEREIPLEDFLNHIRARIDVIRPLHILYEGAELLSEIDFDLYFGGAVNMGWGIQIGLPEPSFENTDIALNYGGSVNVWGTITIAWGEGE